MIIRSARDRWGQSLGCLCAAVLIVGASAYADDAETADASSSADQPAAAESPAPAAEDADAVDESSDRGQSSREAEADRRTSDEQQNDGQGSVDRALRKLATIPRPYVQRSTPAEREKTAGSAQYRLPSGTRVIVIHPGSQESIADTPEDAAAPDAARHSDGQVSEPNRLGLQHHDAIHNSAPTGEHRLGLQHRDAIHDSVTGDTSGLGLQHRDAIRHSVSSVPIGDDIHGRAPDWQSEVIGGEIADRDDPRLRNATVISGPYAPYRPGYRPLNYPRGFDDNLVYTEPAGEYFRFGFVPGSRYERLHAKANARTDRLLNSADKFRARGIAYLHEGRYRQAANAFKVSADTNHHDPAARLYAAHAYFAVGRYRDAVEFLERAFELQPKIAWLNYDLRDDYGSKADFDLHLGALVRAVERSPRNVDRLVLLGYVFCYTNQRDVAWEPLLKAYKLEPDNGLIIRLVEATQPPDVELEKAGIELPEHD